MQKRKSYKNEPFVAAEVPRAEKRHCKKVAIEEGSQNVASYSTRANRAGDINDVLKNHRGKQWLPWRLREALLSPVGFL